MLEKPSPHFFVVGADRSGTTLLRLMLNEHPRLSVGPETWFFLPLLERFEVGRELSAAEVEEAVDLVLSHPRFREYPVEEEAFRARVAQLERPTIGRIFALLPAAIAEQQGKALFGDKTPGYARCVPQLAQAFPKAKFVHLVRDARDVALSLVKVGWYGGRPWRSAEHWIERVRASEQARAELGPTRMIRLDYSDLVLKTESTLRRLCGFLELEFDPVMLRYHERAQRNILRSESAIHTKTSRLPSPQDVDRWQREADRRFLLYVEGGAAPLMRRVGQQPSLTGPWRVLARSAWLWALVRMRLLFPLRHGVLRLLRGEGKWDDPVERALREEGLSRAEAADGDSSEPMKGST